MWSDYRLFKVDSSNSINNGTLPFTVMSADFDNDNEPDYTFILQFTSRQNTAPIRFDFINIPGLGMAQKSFGAQSMPNVGQIGVGYKQTDGVNPTRYTDDQFINPVETPVTTANALAPCSHYPYGRNIGTTASPHWVYETFDPYYDKYYDAETGKFKDNIPEGFSLTSTAHPSDGSNHGCIAVSLTGGTIHQKVYGGCMGTTENDALGLSKNVVVELNKGIADNAKGYAVKGSIFGCNNANSTPEGTVTVHVYGTQHEGKSQIANTAICKYKQ